MVGALSDGFEQSYVELFVRAERIAMRILQNRAESEDVAAETMTKAMGSWMRIRTYRTPWVTKVATNLAVDQLRRRARIPGSSTAPLDAPEPTDRMVIASSLRHLSKRQRQALVFHYLVGLSIGETASAMGITTGSAKTHIQRGLTAMRDQLGADFKEALDAP